MKVLYYLALRAGGLIISLKQLGKEPGLLLKAGFRMNDSRPTFAMFYHHRGKHGFLMLGRRRDKSLSSVSRELP